MLSELWAMVEGTLLPWLGAYLLLYLLGTQLAWWTRRAAPASWFGSLRTRWGGWLVELARLVYYLLLPYLALLQGLVSRQDMGLLNQDWPLEIIQAGLGTVAALILLGWGWQTLARAAPRYPAPESWVRVHLPWGWSYLLRDALYMQASWAFYRAALIPLVGRYYGILAGCGLWLLVTSLNPGWRAALGKPGKRESVLENVSMALVTTFLFLWTNNLWLCAACQILLQLSLARWGLEQRRGASRPKTSEKGLPLFPG